MLVDFSKARVYQRGSARKCRYTINFEGFKVECGRNTKHDGDHISHGVIGKVATKKFNRYRIQWSVVDHASFTRNTK